MATTAKRYVSQQSGYTTPRNVQKDEIIYPSYYIDFFDRLENIKTLWMEWQTWKGDTAPKTAGYYKNHYGINDEIKKDLYIDDELIEDFYNASSDLISHFDKLKAAVNATGNFEDLVNTAIKAGELTLTNGSTYNEMSTLIKTMENVCAHNATDYSYCPYCPNTPTVTPGGGSGGSAYSPFFGGNGGASGNVRSDSCTGNCGGYTMSGQDQYYYKPGGSDCSFNPGNDCSNFNCNSF